MSSPLSESPAVSSSPLSLRAGEHDGFPRRRGSISGAHIVIDDPQPSSLTRLSPTLARTFDPNDPAVRERQRTMDVDMAMQLSRARSATINVPNPSVSPSVSLHHRGQPADEHLFPLLSPHEEEQLDIARGGFRGEDTLHTDRPDDPSILAPLDPVDDSMTGGLPMYQPNLYRSNYDFSHMARFASEEKAQLGLLSPGRPSILASSSRGRSEGAARAPELIEPDVLDLLALPDAVPPPDFISAPELNFSKMRQRKLSQSNTHPRRSGGTGGSSRKMALFEGNIGAPPLRDVPSIDYAENGALRSGGVQFGASAGQGHDRPYRFSFYSNGLSATIHARSLSELPADGQSFEDLFSGRGGDGTRSNSSTARNTDGVAAEKDKRVIGRGNQSSERGDAEGMDTWWLDVMSPTDEEMKMLSKVFSIHPLTTEDIQMEETREKIELFRNYYLVCFRSFDQDQYSPTYLEPLNMYIIVFREGTLSFHFRGTPHPQNVRRRIKQLKDYISVSSDWISYALIDDITDAFGPLIQSIEYEVDSIDELVLILKEAEQSDMLRRIGTCRKKVMGLLRLMGNKADVVKGLAKRCNENWSVAPKSDIGLYLSDIQDHLITMTQNLNHYEKILSRSHSNYLAQISIEMTDANNQINDVLSKLTALGTVLIPMNLVTGLWGMNVHVPGQDDSGSYNWFISIIGALAAFALVGGFLTYRLMVRR